MKTRTSIYQRGAEERKLRDMRSVYPLVVANPQGGWLAVIEHTITYFDADFHYIGSERLKLANPTHAQLYLKLGKAKRERAGEYWEPIFTEEPCMPLNDTAVDELFTFGDHL